MGKGEPQCRTDPKKESNSFITMPASRATSLKSAQQDKRVGKGGSGSGFGAAPQMQAGGGGNRKIFVGTLPDGIDEGTLRSEFSRYGQIVDIFVKMNAEPGRQWAFITFSTDQEAQ